MISRLNTPPATSIALPQMLNEMDIALSDEITKQSTFKQIKRSAIDGKLLSEGNGQYLYQFTLTEPWEPQDDGQLSVANPAAQGLKCAVVTSTGTLLTISSERPLPAEILRQIDFYDDTTELLKRLKEALQQGEEGEAKLGSKSFGLLNSTSILYTGEIKTGTFRLRPKQVEAVKLALGGEITFIVGPPGTGKTATLAAVALKHLQARQTVLIAAHTNIAIDNAIMKLCDLCKNAGDGTLLAQGQVIRYGAVQKEELKKNDHYQEVYLPKVARFLGLELHTQHEHIKSMIDDLNREVQNLLQKQGEEEKPYQAEYQPLRTQIDARQKELILLEQVEEKRITMLQKQQRQHAAELQRLTAEEKLLAQELARTKAGIAEHTYAHSQARQNEQTLLTQLVTARAMSSITRLFKGIKLEKLELQVAGISQTIYHIENTLVELQKQLEYHHRTFMQCGQKRQAKEAELHTIHIQLNTLSENARKIASLKEEQNNQQQRLQKIQALLQQNARRYQQEYQDCAEQQAQLEEQLANVDKQLQAIEKSIVENACVIGTTLTKTYMNQIMAKKRFDAVIIDEVSMAPLPLVYVAASRADSSVTLIGDPQQLAPIASGETPMVEKWLKQDLFTYRGVSLGVAARGDKQSILLDTQSRMHPHISIIANKHVYDNQLRDEFSTAGQKKIQPVPEHSLVLCDTHDGSPTVSRPPNRKSRRNYYHALCSLALARCALESAPEMKQKAERSIGIVTPYRPQAQLLQRLIVEAGLQSWVQAGTVHRFQGLEFEVVIFDTVESPGLLPGEFIAGSKGSNSMRLVNVAVTRPKQKLYIIAHLPHIQNTLPAQSTLRLAVEEASRSAVLPSLEIVGTPFSTIAARLQKQLASTGNASAAVDHSLANDAFQNDLKNLLNEDVLVLNPAAHSKIMHAARNPQSEIQHFTEYTFYQAFKRDIQNARKSICIATPFLAEMKLNAVLPWLIEQKKKGVAVEIFTKPLEEGEREDAEFARQAKSSNIEIVYKPKMHEKIVIIDEKILYHGSLNVLSQNESEESMLRITVPGVIKDVYESLKLSGPERVPINIDDATFRNLPAIKISLSELATATKCTCGMPLIPIRRSNGTGIFFGCSQHDGSQKKRNENLAVVHLLNVKILQNQRCKKCGSPTSFFLQNTWGQLQKAVLVCDANCGEMQRITFV